ncbi:MULTISPECIES: Flp family type IVb pilin [Pseudovibrio]|uniref:Pilus assembly protein Flp/PilA n=1 Tax=Pseudovibrio ascidiaceicola TaxID=285279 RepID=A0A1I4BCV6_9HYPH|nr:MULTISPECIES: Flp family type IVb pilin [Pseudovibrio]KZL11382.1 Flp/Fap pilin component [Pseudovibrio sp. Ad26]SFK66615.1 pilus assembly protein Flp/PilA [Pseudovibrio ascidiaceicola]
MFAKFLKDESGATAIEYGLIAGFISVVIIGAVATIGTEIAEIFQAISTGLTGRGDAASTT